MADDSLKPTRRISRRRFLGRALGGALGGGLLAAGYGRFIEPWWVEESTVRIPVANLPPALDGLRIAHLTDIHYQSCSLEEVADWVERTNARSPELICMTGDYVSGHPKHAADLAPVLARLSAPLGVLACLGNHDYGHAFPRDDADHLALGRRTTAILRDAGAEVLINRAAVRERGGCRFEVFGVGEYWSADWDPPALGPATLRPRIVLAHNPDVFYELDRSRYDLMLAGHTHGGQIQIPFLGPLRTATRHRELAVGHHRQGATHLYTSRGLGYGYPIRFNSRPELPILELTAAP